MILLFPFLFVAGAAGLFVRWLRRLLPGLKAAGGRRPPWVFLSTTRLASAPRLAAALVTISSVALGILVYGGILESSARATATEKASLAIGSDVSIPVGGFQVVEGHPPFASTTVERFSGVGVYPGPAQADVLAVDPGSFAPAAYWPANLGPPLSGLVSKLPANAGPLPVVSVGPQLPLGARLVIGGGQEVPILVVAHVEAFPGAVGSGPTLVADRSAVARTFPADVSSLKVGFELWARGDPALILRVLRNLGFGVDLAATAAKARTTPAFLALSWTLGLLQALGILAAGVAALVLVSYLQARQRGREVSYALARRMGLTRSAHRRAVRAELLVMLFAAFVLGSALSTAAAALVNSRLDPVPDLPPNPFLSIPGSLFAVTALSLVLVSVVGARLVQRRADRADVAAVMRLSG